ncbi:MAG: DNA repair protein RecO [Pseudomonadales bacterium]|nr:DNA repair protein RecO [Pseudomonadales bacterium]
MNQNRSKPPDDKIHAWLLHSRPFRETSLLLDFFSLERGRFSAIARGVRAAKNPRRALLQPFTPLSLGVAGKTDLLTLKAVDADGPALLLSGAALFSALYVNELMTRLLSGVEPEPLLFAHYENTLHALQSGGDVEVALRLFELQLLDVLGYGVDFAHDAEHGAAVEAQAHYYWHGESGLVRQHDTAATTSREHPLYGGAELLAIAQRDFSQVATRRAAKALLRQLLGKHLGERELASRALFRPAKAEWRRASR